MPYTSPPNFSDGAILTATQLNNLSDNIEFLYGVVQGVNVPFSSLRTEGIELTSANNQWTVRHLHRYLHYRMRQITGTSSNVKIYYNGQTVFEDGGTRNAPYTWSGYIDLNSSPGGLTIGNVYDIYVTNDFAAGNVFSVDYLLESDGTSI